MQNYAIVLADGADPTYNFLVEMQQLLVRRIQFPMFRLLQLLLLSPEARVLADEIHFGARRMLSAGPDDQKKTETRDEEWSTSTSIRRRTTRTSRHFLAPNYVVTSAHRPMQHDSTNWTTRMIPTNWVCYMKPS